MVTEHRREVLVDIGLYGGRRRCDDKRQPVDIRKEAGAEARPAITASWTAATGHAERNQRADGLLGTVARWLSVCHAVGYPHRLLVVMNAWR